MFYDEIFDLLEKQKILSSITEKEKDFQQASYEIYVTEIDYVKDLRVMIDVRFNCEILIEETEHFNMNFIYLGILSTSNY